MPLEIRKTCLKLNSFYSKCMFINKMLITFGGVDFTYSNFYCVKLDCRVEASSWLSLAEPNYVSQDLVYEIRQ